MNNFFLPLSSLLIPGLPQIIKKSTWRGITILVSFLILSFLVFWADSVLKIGIIHIGGISVTLLLVPLVIFYIWNVIDAFMLVSGKKFPAVFAIISACLILFSIGWNVTDVKMERLITRIQDARVVFTKLLNPDFISTYDGEKVVVCGWTCVTDYAKSKLQGQEVGEIFLSENVGRIFGKQGTITARSWDVLFGRAQLNDRIPGFETGKIVETIAIGLLATLFSTVLAAPLSFLAAHNIMNRIPGGQVIYYISRTILNIVRAVDTVVWGLMIVVWVGLGSFAGVIALTIHSTAALAKLFSEEIEHIDPGPVEAVEATGSNLFQIIRYAVVPQIIPSFLSFTLLRWDINMRSATIIGFVAGGGIGFFVLETIRMGGYQQYAAALWTIAVVIILVDYISSRWRFSIMEDKINLNQNPSFWSKLKIAFYFVIGIAVFAYFWEITRINLSALFDPGKTFGRLIGDFFAIDLSPSVLRLVTREMIVTIMQALMATTFGGLVAIPFSFLAAKNLTGKSKFSAWIFYGTRSIFNVLRSIEALLYVAIFVFWVGIGPFAGTLALSITTFALLGKLFSESIENIDPGPIEATVASGANRLQTIVYSIVPQIVPPFISYLIYQWDINIRMATIIGFAGGGGIGLTLSSYFGSLQYHKAGTIVLFIVIVVALMDFASAKIREKFI